MQNKLQCKQNATVLIQHICALIFQRVKMSRKMKGYTSYFDEKTLSEHGLYTLSTLQNILNRVQCRNVLGKGFCLLSGNDEWKLLILCPFTKHKQITV